MKAKNCPRCGENLPITEFGRNRQTPDGLHYYCKSCAAERQRNWARANPEKVRAMRAAYLRRIREQNEGRDPYSAAA
jgi:transposase-like protein